MKVADISVEYISHMGDDTSVVNAARCSFDKKVDVFDEIKDAKLIKYLADNNHISPFHHTFISLRVKAPIFVARQLVKHAYLPWNEVSRRYVDSEPEFYFPEYWRKKAENIKQGSSNEVVDISIKRHDDPYYVKFHNMQARAKREGVYFDLKLEDMVWPDKCSVLGTPLVYELGRGRIMEDSPSIDRINPNKPYTKDNIRIISHKANTMKSNATKEELITFAEEILLTHKGYVPDYDHSPEGVCRKALDFYNYLLSIGTCAEQARMVLPLNTMTEWVWSGTLSAFAKMLVLRLDAHTQKETRDVAVKIKMLIEPLFPVSLKALLENK